MSLDSQTKEKIYSRVSELVTRKHFDPGMNGANWEELSKTRKDQILRSRGELEERSWSDYCDCPSSRALHLATRILSDYTEL